jgi:hypothetical protein
VKVEYIGVISEEVSEMLEALFSKFSFLGWSGRYVFDPRGDFNLRYACECTSLEESSKKWMHAQTMRRSGAHPDNCSQHTPMPDETNASADRYSAARYNFHRLFGSLMAPMQPRSQSPMHQ